MREIPRDDDYYVANRRQTNAATIEKVVSWSLYAATPWSKFDYRMEWWLARHNLILEDGD